MTDKEKTEEDKFRQILQDACSFSDEQLLRDLEKAEKALGEFEFSGAEERIFKKLMEREAINTERMRREEGEEKAAEKVPGTAVEKELKTVPEKESKKVAERVSEVASQKEPEAAMIKATGTASVEASEKTPEAALHTTSEENADKALGKVSEKISEAATERIPEKATEAALHTTSEENSDKALVEVSEKISEAVTERISEKATEATLQTALGKGKVLRFGRRKRMLMVALIAAFVGMLGAKAVGEDSYFFHSREKNLGVIMNNGRNYTNVSDLDEAYKLAGQELQIRILKMSYCPDKMEFIELNINENKAVFVFKYGKEKVHVFQMQRSKETSFNSSSDTDRKDIVVHNKWINQDAYIQRDAIDSQNGYSAVMIMGDGVYRITGAIPEAEMKKIVENLNFY